MSDLQELIASVGALRRTLEGRGEKAPRTPPAAENSAEASASVDPSSAIFSRLSNVDPARWLARLRERLPFPVPADVSREVDAFGLDPPYLERARPLLDFLFDRWWRVHVSGLDRVPDSARMLLVANRSGILPYDGLMLAHAVERGHRAQRRPRLLAADKLMSGPFAQPMLRRLGAVRACRENAARLFDEGEWLSLFPEGGRGALKPYRQRYRLQRFECGEILSLALRRRAPIVPVAIVGGEEIHPVALRPEKLERLLGTALPLAPTLLLGPGALVPLPSQWRIRFGSPLEVGDLDPASAEDPLTANRLSERVRAAVGELLEDELERRDSVW
ncbi:MAG: acyltransferase family protein [Proteobacteria bacterium]|nr:acyltransferase family protein [Pseudomonadota bacterium]